MIPLSSNGLRFVRMPQEWQRPKHHRSYDLHSKHRLTQSYVKRGVYDPSEHLLGVQPLPHTQRTGQAGDNSCSCLGHCLAFGTVRRGSKPTLLGRKSEAPKVSDEGAADAEDAKEAIQRVPSSGCCNRHLASEHEEVMTESTSSTTRRHGPTCYRWHATCDHAN